MPILSDARILYDGSNAMQAKVQYLYDEAGYLQAHATQPIRHDSTTNGTAGNYGANFSYRGNLTTVRRYNVTDSSSVENKTGYYITGHPAYTRDALNHQTTFSYNGTYLTDGGYTETRPNTYAYPGSVTDPDGFSSTLIYHFDRGDVRRTIDPKGAQVRRDYDGMGRMWKVTNETNSAYTRYNFDPNHNFVQSYTTIQEGQGEFYSITTVDGHGRTRANASDHPGSTTNFKGQYTGYDNMGRVYQQSNPAEMNGTTWNPAGDDSAGWAWRYQTYDWQSRPLITTNQDGTTKSVSYEGCGCAGSDVATITDELLRKTKIYRDVLGREIKTELLKQDGSVYLTKINLYNVRDQIKEAKQIVGTNGATQMMTLDYDGHGRLKCRKLPIEGSSSLGTRYTYYANDKLETVTDPRSVVTTHTYNLRDLVVGTSFNTNGNSAIDTVNPISFTYDAVGNILSRTDETGSHQYSYDVLSRLEWEKRHFNGLAPDYYTYYQYNLGGQVKQVTDPFGDILYYNYDKSGRIKDVTGSNYGGTYNYTDPATPVKYRAWGAVQQVKSGHNFTTTIGYNIRTQVQSFHVTGRHSSYGAPVVMDSNYLYNADNSPLFASDLTAASRAYDRAYAYDHVGRSTAAYTGNNARSFANQPSPPGTNVPGPYFQDYDYNEFGDLTFQQNNFWSRGIITTNSYDMATGRNTNSSWDYDPNSGYLKKDDKVSFRYDAGGFARTVEQISPPLTQKHKITQLRDGDGTIAKREEAWGSNGSYTNFYSAYYLYSTALGGQLLTRIDSAGQKIEGYVYLEDLLIAKQEKTNNQAFPKQVRWQHQAPVIGKYGYSFVDGQGYNYYERVSEPDSTGVNVGYTDPFYTPPPQPINDDLVLDPSDINSNKCLLDGIPADCTLVANILRSGAGVRAPEWNVRANAQTGGLDVFNPNAAADGYNPWIPVGASYQGNGLWNWNQPKRTREEIQRNFASRTPSARRSSGGYGPDEEDEAYDGVLQRASGVRVGGQRGNGRSPAIVPDKQPKDFVAPQPNPACDAVLAGVFGGSGAVAAGSGYEPDALLKQRGAHPNAIGKFSWHEYRYMHLYPTVDGKQSESPVGVYIPKDGSKVPNVRPFNIPIDEAGTTYQVHYNQLGSLSNVTLYIYHVGDFRVRLEGNRVRIGNIGGPGVDRDPTYSHSHFSIKGKKGAYSFVDAFCR